MVPVTFMGHGRPKRLGFKVTIWWQQATKGTIFYEGSSPLYRPCLKEKMQTQTNRMHTLTQLTIDRIFHCTLLRVIQGKVKNNLMERKGNKGSFTYDICLKVKKFNPLLLLSKILKISDCIRTILFPSWLALYANNP